LAAWRVHKLPADPRSARAEPFEDGRGALLFTAATALTLLWLNFAGHRFPWLSTAGIALGASAAALWWLLLLRERALANPLLPIELLRVPGIATMAGTVTLFASCFFAFVFFLPIYLQLGAGAASLRASLLLLPITLGMVIGSITSGRIVARTARPAPIPVVGLTLAACALTALSFVPPTTTRVALLGLACGIGFGTVMPTAQVTIQTLAGRAKLGAAAAVVSLARSVGAVLGTALFGALVFGLMRGANLDAVLHASSAATAANVLPAFQTGFLAVAAVAAVGAMVASRLPPLRL